MKIIFFVHSLRKGGAERLLLQIAKYIFNKGHEIIQVETTLLSKLLEKHNVTKIDFLSIDTEGSELAILKTIDFNKIFIDVITVEDNYNNPELLDFFKKRNYRLVKTIKCDKIFKLNNN